MLIHQVLSRRYPGLIFRIRDNDYAQLVIISGGDKPSQVELEALWPSVAIEIEVENA